MIIKVGSDYYPYYCFLEQKEELVVVLLAIPNTTLQYNKYGYIRE